MAAMDLEKKVFGVLYEFEGKEAAEISSLAPGDIVIALPQEKKDDWILVITHKAPHNKGYVPRTFLQQLPDSDAGNYIRSFEEPDLLSAQPVPQAPDPPAAPPSSSTQSSSSSSAAPAEASHPTGTPVGTPPPLTNPTSPAPFSASGNAIGLSSSSRLRDHFRASLPRGSATPRTAANAESFNEMFARHEHYFKQVMKQREETFKKLESAMQSAAKDIASCQEKNAKLAQRITDLDALIEEERKRWKERLEAEKKTLLMKGIGTGAAPSSPIYPPPSPSSQPVTQISAATSVPS